MDRAPLKFENTAEVGHFIKAYDHEPREGVPHLFVVGLVSAKIRHPQFGFWCYRVICERDSAHAAGATKGGRIGDLVYVPFQVSPLDWPGRVTKVDGIWSEPLTPEEEAFRAKALEKMT